MQKLIQFLRLYPREIDVCTSKNHYAPGYDLFFEIVDQSIANGIRTIVGNAVMAFGGTMQSNVVFKIPASIWCVEIDGFREGEFFLRTCRGGIIFNQEQ